MPTYSITAPNGKTYSIDGPEGATQDEVISQILAMDPTAGETSKQRASMIDAATGDNTPTPAAQQTPDYSLSGAFNEAIEQGGGYGIDPETKKFIAGERADMPFLQQGPVSYARQAVANAIDYGVVPFQAVGYGAEALAEGADRLAEATGLADLPSLVGIDQKILPGTAAMALGEAFPLGGMETGILHPPALNRNYFEETSKDVNARINAGQSVEDIMAAHPDLDVNEVQVAVNYKRQGGQEEIGFIQGETPGANGRFSDPEEARLASQFEQQIGPQAPVTAETPGLAGQLQREAEAFQQRRTPEPTAEDVFPTEEQIKQREATIAGKLQNDVDAWKAKRAPEEAPIIEEQAQQVRGQQVNSVVDEVNTLASTWKAAPEIEVAYSIDELPTEYRNVVDPDAKGFVAPDGKVHIIAGNLADKSDIPAVLYHEALGHTGLSRLFRDDLDNILTDIYNTNETYRAKADQWLQDNPGAYADSPNSVARALDEVFAEASEGGPQLPPAVMDRIKNTLKKWARRAGLKNVQYSDREVQTILQMAHDAVINGKGADVVGNGFRYMYVGKNARLNDMAKMMDFTDEYIEGGDPVSLRDKYGFFRGPDRQLRREISDDTAVFSLGDIQPTGMMADPDSIPRGSVRLDQVLDHPELFENYPTLRNVKIIRQDDAGDWAQRSQGWFDSENNTINITPYAKDPESVLLHEIQHWVQNYEDWASGGNEQVAVKAMTDKQFKKFKNDFLKESEAHYNEKFAEADMMDAMVNDPAISKLARNYTLTMDDLSRREQELGRPDFNDPEYSRLYDHAQDARLDLFEGLTGKDSFFDAPEASAFYQAENSLKNFTIHEDLAKSIDELEEVRQALEELAQTDDRKVIYRAARGSNTSFKAYQNIFGEIEARDVQARMNMSPEERARTLPYSSANDVPEQSLILSHGGRSYSTEGPSGGEVRQMRGDRPKKSMSPAGMRTKFDIDDMLEFIGNETEHLASGPKTLDEIEYAATDLGLTNSKFLRGKSFEEQKIAAQVRGAQQLLVNNVEQLAQLGERAKTEGLTPSLYANIQEKLAITKAVYAKFDENTSEIGRALRMLREVAESRKSTEAAFRFMEDNRGLDILSDPESVQRLLNNLEVINKTDGPEAAAKAIRQATKLRLEDYAGSVVFNFMLSSPVTWLKNAVGTPFNFATDVVSDIAAGIADPALRSREFGARMTGLAEAAKQYQTWKNIFDAFVHGETTRPGLEGKVGNSRMAFSNTPNIAAKAAGAVVETPARVMAGVDEFWSNFFYMSNLYGEASKLATKEGRARGMRSKDWYGAKLQELIDNPTEELLESARKMTDRQLFRDEPSAFTKKLMEAVTPRYEDEVVIKMVKNPETGKMEPRSKVTLPKSTGLQRAGKFTGRVAVPFMPTLDSIARTLIRNSGLLSPASSEVRTQLMTPGTTRQSALARMGVATAAMGLWAYMADKGDITGSGPGEWKQGQAEGSVRPPFSIRVGDQWISYAGYDPLSGQIAVVADAVDSYKRRGEEISPEIVRDGITGITMALMTSSYAESLMNMFKMAGEGVELIKEGENPMSATKNFIAGQAANVMVPAGVRYVNQEFLDPQARDTSGTGSILDRALSRAQAGIPGKSQELPQRYDVFGREVLNPRQPKKVETDPTVLEVYRLERASNKVVMGPPDKTIYKGSEYQKKLTGEEFQKYQQLSGFWAMQDIKEAMADPEWKEMSDTEKVKTIKDILSESRKDAREELFPKPEEEEEEVE